MAGKAAARLALFAQEAHQFCKRRFHLVLHLGDEFVLAHAFMIERLGIALRKRLQVLLVENAALDELGENDEQAVGVGDIASHERLVDHRKTRVLLGVLFFNVGHMGNLDNSDGGATPAYRRSAAHASDLSANGRVSAALDDGRSMKVRRAWAASARRPMAAAVLPLKATASRRGWAAIYSASWFAVASRMASSRLPCRRASTT